MARCDSHFQHGLEYRCYALEHPAVCTCRGDTNNCTFFPFLPEKRTPKHPPIDCKKCVHNPVCELWRQQEAQDASSLQLNGCDLFENIEQFKWIPVDERFPSKEDRYLVINESGNVFDAYFDLTEQAFGEWREIFDGVTLGVIDTEWLSVEEITHWMRIPKPLLDKSEK